MTKDECYAEIERNNQLISQYRAEIEQKKREIQELTSTKAKVESLNSYFTSCRDGSCTKLTGISALSKINDRMTGKYHDGMNEMLTGAEYNNVSQGVETGIAQLVNEIIKKQNEIAQLENSIVASQNRIQQMQAEIARIEEEERRAAEAAAAAAAAEAEAAAAATTSKSKK